MAPNYVITGQRQMQDIGPDGRVRDVMQVSFQTASGTHASVNVPLDMYSPENVHRIVDDFVSRIEGVHEL